MGEAAQKMCKLDVAELLDLLNRAYAEEWLAYYQYWVGAQVIAGPMRPLVQDEFLKHAKEELEHAHMLADRIIQLGGTPLLAPSEWLQKARCGYEVPRDVATMALLKQNLDSERCAIARYQQICDACFGKDYETFDIALKIMHDELDHEQDWEDFIEDLEQSAKFYHENA